MPKYNSIDTIPAKVFFDILKTKNYQLLKPKPREKELDKVFISIYDEFFLKSNNEEAKEFLQLSNEIAFLTYKIELIKATLHFAYYNPTTPEIRLSQIKALNEGCGLNIDENADFGDEILRILTENVGWFENDLEFAKAGMNEMVKTSQNKDYDYYDRIGALSTVLPNNTLLKESMSLAVYVTLEKEAQKVIERSKKNK